MPFSRLRKGAFCIFLNPRLNGKPGVVHLYWQLMACGDSSCTTSDRYVKILEFRHFVEFFSFNRIAENHKALCYCRQKNSGSEWVVSCNGWLPAFLYSGNFIQQNKTKGRSVNDSKDLCIYVVDCNQVDRFIFYRNLPDFLVKKTLHKQLTFDKKYVCFKITNSARYEWGSRYGKRKERETDT